ncbi:MAG: rhomboid family intramembrane serine protease [Alphaproteobacteria bacterium]|nr:rhomboid family intramembrane serine protease [Alphaproteobacteria bacterium]
MSGDENRQRGAKDTSDKPVPVFNVPIVVLGAIGFIVAVHLATTLVLDGNGVFDLYVWLAFIPVRLTMPAEFPGGMWPLLWTPVTHAFLHGGWEHLAFNGAWLLVFGTPVARRYGAPGFAMLFVVGAVAGALAFAVTNLSTIAVVIGASGAISGLTGAAVRFVFQPAIFVRDPDSGRPVAAGRRLANLKEFVANRRALVFTGVWLLINLGIGVFALVTKADSGIAWQAHVGGFLAGFVAVAWLERRLI